MRACVRACVRVLDLCRDSLLTTINLKAICVWLYLCFITRIPCGRLEQMRVSVFQTSEKSMLTDPSTEKVQKNAIY